MNPISSDSTYFDCKEASTQWAGVDVIISNDEGYEELTPELFTTSFTVSFDDCYFTTDVAGWSKGVIENMGKTMETYTHDHEPIARHNFLFRKIPKRPDLYQQYECE